MKSTWTLIFVLLSFITLHVIKASEEAAPSSRLRGSLSFQSTTFKPRVNTLPKLSRPSVYPLRNAHSINFSQESTWVKAGNYIDLGEIMLTQ